MEDHPAVVIHPAVVHQPAMEHQPETEHQQEVEAGQASGSSGSEKAIALHPGSSVNDPEAPATSGQLVSSFSFIGFILIKFLVYKIVP